MISKKIGQMSGYTFIGWLDPTGELRKNESPRSPHIPIYWEILESEEWFCFSQQALHETVAKNAILSVDQWKRLVQGFSQSWHFLGFIHEQSGRCINHVPPPLLQKTKVRLHTEHGEFDVFACALKETLQKECGALPLGFKMRLVPRPCIGLLRVMQSYRTALSEIRAESSEQAPVTYSWQVQSDAPNAVKDCLHAWKDGVTLDKDDKRLIDRHASCADKNPNIWFCPPSPAEAMDTAWTSLLTFYHQSKSPTDCWYDHIHRKRRRLSQEQVTHNTLPTMDYDRHAVNAWLTEFPIQLQVKSSSATLSDNCHVELQDVLLRQTHSITIKDLKKLTSYHKLASEIAAASATATPTKVCNFFYVGTLLTHESDVHKLAVMLRFLKSSSMGAGRSPLSSQDKKALSFNLADFMHVPESQFHNSGNWIAAFKSGGINVRKHQSYTDCEAFWSLRRERRLTRRGTGELEWRLDDFHRNAKRNGVKYLGKPAKQGRLHDSIPDLDNWITTYSVQMPAVLTHEWDEKHVPDQDALQSLLWWKSDTGIPFQARYGEVRNNLDTMSKQCRFGVEAFKDLGKLLKLKYLGPLVQHVQVIDGQQTKRNAWQPDENAIPEQPSSWPPWKRPVYWCLIEKQSTGDTRTHHVFRSVSELLELGTAECHIELRDYEVLARSMGYTFLGTEVTLNDGKVIQSDQATVLTEKDVVESNMLCPPETDIPCFWLDPSSDRILQRLSYHFLHCKRGSSMPTIQALSAFLQASSDSADAETQARCIFEGKCTEMMFEDLLRNSKVHTLLMKTIVRRSLARIKAEFEPENDTENTRKKNIKPLNIPATPISNIFSAPVAH